MHRITYRTGTIPSTAAIIDVYDDSGLRRPTDDAMRIAEMYANSNLVITAWVGEQLVGVARSLTDFCFCCYLSDLAIAMDYQRYGIGKELIRLTREAIGPRTMLLLLSAPGAMEYYPHIGMESVTNGFIYHRSE